MDFVNVTFYIRISPIVYVGFLIVALLGTFVFNFSSKHPIISLSLSLAVMGGAIYYEMKARKGNC
jgi:hypothetical protein